MTAERTRNKLAISAPADEPVIVLTREFDAPRELVFALHTEPQHLRRWWGPRYITLSECEIDLRPGGAWRYVFAKTGGPPMTFRGEYREVSVPERLVYTFIFDVDQIRDHPALVTLVFQDLGGRTGMTQTVRHDSFEARDGHLHSGMETGAAEGFDRLEELLETMPRTLRLTRVFNAPRDLVFRAWTEPERLARWWGPRGFTTPLCQADARPGGTIRIDMRGPDGRIYPMHGQYREVIPPERIVFTSWAPGPDGAPMFEMLNTVTFADCGAGTEMTLDVRALHVTGHAARPLSGMTQGWTESLDRLQTEAER